MATVLLSNSDPRVVIRPPVFPAGTLPFLRETPEAAEFSSGYQRDCKYTVIQSGLLQYGLQREEPAFLAKLIDVFIWAFGDQR